MKVAIIGSRGIPPNYGGFETAAYYISKYIADKNEEVLVYCLGESKKLEFNYKNIKRVFIPVIHRSSLEKLMLSNLSIAHAVLVERVDGIILLGVQGNPLLPLAKLFGKKVVLTFDGLEWKREKWNYFGKKAFKILEKMGSVWDITFVADSKGIQEYLKTEYGIDSYFIPYGAGDCFCSESDWERAHETYGIEKKKYFIVVGRNVPENNFGYIIKAFGELTDIKYKLVVVSDIERHVEDNIIFTGPIYDHGLLASMRKNSVAYIHGHSVGGTNPSLLESIACGNRVIAYDVVFNREVLGAFGTYFKNDKDLKEIILSVVKKADNFNEAEMEKYYENIINNIYNWEIVGEKYYKLLKE